MSRTARPEGPADGPAAGGIRSDAQWRLAVAAIEQFAAHGFHGTTTRDIARAAGMSPAGLYIHHSSKEELLYRISLEGHRIALDVVMGAAATSADPAEQLAEIMRRFVAHHAREHTSARILNYELAALSPDHLREITEIRKTIEGLVREVVEAGVATGQFRTASPRLTSIAVLSLTIDVARWYRDDRRWDPEELADHYSELALRIAGADPGRSWQARPAPPNAPRRPREADQRNPAGPITASPRSGNTSRPWQDGDHVDGRDGQPQSCTASPDGI